MPSTPRKLSQPNNSRCKDALANVQMDSFVLRVLRFLERDALPKQFYLTRFGTDDCGSGIGGWQTTTVVERIEPLTRSCNRIDRIAQSTSAYFVDFGFSTPRLLRCRTPDDQQGNRSPFACTHLQVDQLTLEGRESKPRRKVQCRSVRWPN